MKSLPGLSWCASAMLAMVASNAVAQEDSSFNPLYEHPRQGHEAFKLEQDPYALSLNLMAQVQTAFWVGDDVLQENWDPATTEGFRLRRARVGFHGLAYDWVGLNIVLDLYEQSAGGDTVHTANIVLKLLDEANLAVGTAPLPYARGSMTSSSLLQLVERPLPASQMAPPSQLGAALFGGVLGEKIEYSVGVYNGGPGMTQADRGEGLLYAARLQVSPLGPVGPAESDCDGSDFRVSLGGGGYYSDDSSVETVAVGTDLRVQWHGLSLAGELLWDRHQPVDDPELPPNPLATIERRGWYAQAGYFLLPARLELSGRYEWYDDQRNEDNAGDLWLATGGMSLWLADGTLKLQLNYIHREERAFVELDNDIVLGQVQVDL